jgi:hypothetical protein
MKLSNFVLQLAIILHAASAVAADNRNMKDDAVDLPGGSIKSYTAAGSGCPGGLAVTQSPDGRTLEVNPDKFKAELVRNGPLSSTRKFCQISVEFTLPEGWTYGFRGVKGSLKTSLHSGAQAGLEITSYFSGGQDRAKASVVATEKDSPTKDFEVEMDSTVFAPCPASRSLQMKLDLRIRGQSESSTGWAEIGGKTHFFLTFKRCGEK